MTLVTLLYDGKAIPLERTRTEDQDLWIPLDALESATGWVLKPEGACRGETCVPLLKPRAAKILKVDGESERWFNLSGFARLIDQPIAVDFDEAVWSFGSPGWEWKSRASGRDAPDFELLDLQERPHTLSELRGKKVFLVFWSSWCTCRFDLPIWQEIREELKGSGFEVITVAADAKGKLAVEEFVAAASPTHPSLIDEKMQVADLFEVVNVPAAFWIDEEGSFVRANDPIYAQRPDPETGEMKRSEGYLDALRDWVANGPNSRYLQDEEALRDRWGPPTLAQVQAVATFDLGVHLAQNAKQERAQRHFQQALELWPENWTFQRQAWEFSGADRQTMRSAVRDPNRPRFYKDLDLNTR